MSIRTRVGAALTALTMLGTLTACDTVDTTPPDRTTAQISESQCTTTAAGNQWQSCQVSLPDTRRVTCVVYATKAVDCDWAHMDGADKGWDQ